jgi:hypothetical protein
MCWRRTLLLPAFCSGSSWFAACPGYPARGRWCPLTVVSRVAKTGGVLVNHAQHYCLLVAVSHMTRRLFGAMLRRILTLPVATGRTKNVGEERAQA